MRLFKGIATYTMVLVLIAVALCIICAGYLFLFPEQDLFGLKYINQDATFADRAEDITEVDTIRINGGNFKISVVPGGLVRDYLYAEMSVRYSGYALKKNAESDLQITTKDNEVIIDVTEPRGFYTINLCEVKVYIPVDFNTFGYSLIINTNKAPVFVGTNIEDETAAKLNIKNIELNTNSGSFQINNNVLINGNFKSDLKAGKVEVENLVQGTVNVFNLTTNKGVFEVKGSDLNIISAYWQNKSVGRLYLYNVSYAEVNGLGGVFDANTVSTLIVNAKSTRIKVGNILASSLIRLSEEGEIDIQFVNAYLEAETNKANILIRNAYEPLSLKSVYGNIKVMNASKLVSAQTKNGSIDVVFPQQVGSYTTESTYRSAMLVSQNGKITVSGVDYLVAKTINNGSIRINATFHKIIKDKENILTSGGGDIKVVTPSTNTVPFIIQTKSSGSVDVYVATARITAIGEQTAYAYGAQVTEITKFIINASGGNIYMRDSSLVNNI